MADNRVIACCGRLLNYGEGRKRGRGRARVAVTREIMDASQNPATSTAGERADAPKTATTEIAVCSRSG